MAETASLFRKSLPQILSIDNIKTLRRCQGNGKKHLYLKICNLNFAFPLFIYHKIASADLKVARTPNEE